MVVSLTVHEQRGDGVAVGVAGRARSPLPWTHGCRTAVRDEPMRWSTGRVGCAGRALLGMVVVTGQVWTWSATPQDAASVAAPLSNCTAVAHDV